MENPSFIMSMISFVILVTIIIIRKFVIYLTTLRATSRYK